MGIMVYSLLWVMQDLYHQPYPSVELRTFGLEDESHTTVDDRNPLHYPQ